MTKIQSLATATLATLALTLTLGCRVDTHKDGKDENVNIQTPFGGMSVKTNDSVVQDGAGLSVYPGAELVKKDKNSNVADVNLNFGSFHLGVKALSYQTKDAPDKVTAFYLKDLSRYGTVIRCRGNNPVGSPTRTPEGLSCDHDGNENNLHINDSDFTDELKAGSKSKQHIVGLEAKDGGTRIGLVALELPGKFNGNDNDKQ